AEGLHPIQEAFVEAGAVQCGYCTPGMIMSAKALLDKNPKPEEVEIRAAIDENLCRCTGYVKIVDAVQLAAQRMNGGA
ncbi:MAG: (2Fe-2S)-binding protein, partial [Anaerolineaceae bacterium]|nr:(2Fe-2S)-binding protein [Anaerolineaceae bacterium]